MSLISCGPNTLTVSDSLNFIFPLWEPHSRILFLSPTNAPQRVHSVAASKQEAEVSDGSSWFYLMRDAWGCGRGCAPWGLLPSSRGASVGLGPHTLRPGWPGSFPRTNARPPHLAHVLLAEELPCPSCAWRTDRTTENIAKDTPHSSTLRWVSGGVCLRAPRRWAQPQRESSVTS